MMPTHHCTTSCTAASAQSSRSKWCPASQTETGQHFLNIDVGHSECGHVQIVSPPMETAMQVDQGATACSEQALCS